MDRIYETETHRVLIEEDPFPETPYTLCTFIVKDRYEHYFNNNVLEFEDDDERRELFSRAVCAYLKILSEEWPEMEKLIVDGAKSYHNMIYNYSTMIEEHKNKSWTKYHKEFEANLKEVIDEICFVEKVYLTNHSGESLSTYEICKFDSSHIGFVYIRRFVPATTISTESIILDGAIENDIEYLNKYLRGECGVATLSAKVFCECCKQTYHNEIECLSFIGSDEEAIAELKLNLGLEGKFQNIYPDN